MSNYYSNIKEYLKEESTPEFTASDLFATLTAGNNFNLKFINRATLYRVLNNLHSHGFLSVRVDRTIHKKKSPINIYSLKNKKQ